LAAAFGDGVIDHYVHAAEWEQMDYDGCSPEKTLYV
jgi:hypothetical protein